MNTHGMKRVLPRLSPKVLSRQSVALNLDKVIRFELGGQILERRLVLTSFDHEAEISTACPVGHKLSDAQPGQAFEVHTLDGNSVVKVLAILS